VHQDYGPILRLAVTAAIVAALGDITGAAAVGWRSGNSRNQQQQKHQKKTRGHFVYLFFFVCSLQNKFMLMMMMMRLVMMIVLLVCTATTTATATAAAATATTGTGSTGRTEGGKQGQTLVMVGGWWSWHQIHDLHTQNIIEAR
jgi:hypothetical protein